jgi:hypothetical protein
MITATSLDETQSTAIRQLFPNKDYEMRSRLGDRIRVTQKYSAKFAQYIEHIEIVGPPEDKKSSKTDSDEIPLFKF